MNSKNREKYEARAAILKAMAHPSRLFIVDRLSEREHCVCELTDEIGADMSTVSKHLSILRNAGLVGSERRGNQIYYHLNVPCAMNFFTCVEEVLAHNAKRHLDAIKSD